MAVIMYHFDMHMHVGMFMLGGGGVGNGSNILEKVGVE